MNPRTIIISEDLVAPWDEGIKKFAFSIGRALATDHPVRIVNVDRSGAVFGNGAGGGGERRTADSIRDVPSTRTFIQPALRREISSFLPEVIIYVPSPSDTVSSFLRAYALHRHAPRAQIGMVALIPRRHPARLKVLLGATAPDVVFVPSYASLLHLNDLSLQGELVPVGVDLDQFRPAHDGEKEALRRAHGIPLDATVYLHVGHLSPKRNVGMLTRLAAEPGAHVIVIGSTSTPEDTALRAGLEAAGVRVIREFVPVEEFYRMADCYVFPVIDSEGCVEIPLSVLESLASGLPVIARAFGGLRDVLPAGDDLRYFDSEDEMVALSRTLRAGVPPVTRDMSAFAWRTVATRIVTRLTRTAEVRS
jgi:glycosyltransferase involved in cell wall biosynthesis